MYGLVDRLGQQRIGHRVQCVVEIAERSFNLGGDGREDVGADSGAPGDAHRASLQRDQRETIDYVGRGGRGVATVQRLSGSIERDQLAQRRDVLVGPCLVQRALEPVSQECAKSLTLVNPLEQILGNPGACRGEIDGERSSVAGGPGQLVVELTAP